MSTLLIIFCGVCIGAADGLAESLWVSLRQQLDDRRKLPHAWLLAARIAVCVIIGLIAAGFTWPALIIAGAMLIPLTMVHRVVYNVSSRQPFHYMGPAKRSKDDSWYDTIVWMAAIYAWEALRWISRRNLRTFHPSVPFIIANTIELTALYFLIKHLP